MRRGPGLFAFLTMAWAFGGPPDVPRVEVEPRQPAPDPPAPRREPVVPAQARVEPLPVEPPIPAPHPDRTRSAQPAPRRLPQVPRTPEDAQRVAEAQARRERRQRRNLDRA